MSISGRFTVEILMVTSYREEFCLQELEILLQADYAKTYRYYLVKLIKFRTFSSWVVDRMLIGFHKKYQRESAH